MTLLSCHVDCAMDLRNFLLLLFHLARLSLPHTHTHTVLKILRFYSPSTFCSSSFSSSASASISVLRLRFPSRHSVCLCFSFELYFNLRLSLLLSFIVVFLLLFSQLLLFVVDTTIRCRPPCSSLCLSIQVLRSWLPCSAVEYLDLNPHCLFGTTVNGCVPCSQRHSSLCRCH
jgi:hypothetical protein